MTETSAATSFARWASGRFEELGWILTAFDQPDGVEAHLDPRAPEVIVEASRVLTIIAFKAAERDGDLEQALRVARNYLGAVSALPSSWTASVDAGLGRWCRVADAHAQIASLLAKRDDLEASLAAYLDARAAMDAWHQDRLDSGLTDPPGFGTPEIPDPRADLLEGLASVAAALGHTELADDALARRAALDAASSLDDRVHAILVEADDAAARNDARAALAAVERAHDAIDAAGPQVVPRARARTFHGQGRLLRWVGDAEGALRCHRAGLELNRQIGALDRMSWDLAAIGDLFVDRPDLGDAVSAHEHALQLRSMPIDSPGVGAWQATDGRWYRISTPAESEPFLWRFAEACRRAGDLDRAASLYAVGVDMSETSRLRVHSSEGRIAFLADRDESNNRLLELSLDRYLASDQRDRALAESVWIAGERSRARTLLDEVSAADLRAPVGVDAALVAEERRLTAAIERIRAEAPSPFPWADYEQLRDDVIAARAAIADQSSAGADYAALRSGVVATLAETQAVLARDANALGRRIHACVLERVASRLVWLCVSSDEPTLRVAIVDADADRMEQFIRRYLGAAGDVRLTALDLGPTFRAMFAPVVAPLVAVSDRDDLLIISPTGVFHHLPFHAVPHGERPLIERNPVTYTPSLSLYRVIGQRADSRGDGACVVGNPTGDLPASETEARQIAALFETTAIMGAAATVAAVHSRLGGADVAHLACHGEFDGAEPMSSGLRLADGRLTARALLEGPELGTRIIALSACRSGVADVDVGDEVFGLVRSLLLAGPSVAISALWDLSDSVTSELMLAFYAALRDGESPALALRRASLEIETVVESDRFDLWAGVVLVGDGITPLPLEMP